MTYREFARQEIAALHRFMSQYADEDFTDQAYPSYSREYRCDCGFRTQEIDGIFEHAATCDNPEVRA